MYKYLIVSLVFVNTGKICCNASLWSAKFTFILFLLQYDVEILSRFLSRISFQNMFVCSITFVVEGHSFGCLRTFCWDFMCFGKEFQFSFDWQTPDDVLLWWGFTVPQCQTRALQALPLWSCFLCVEVKLKERRGCVDFTSKWWETSWGSMFPQSI